MRSASQDSDTSRRLGLDVPPLATSDLVTMQPLGLRKKAPDITAHGFKTGVDRALVADRVRPGFQAVTPI